MEYTVNQCDSLNLLTKKGLEITLTRKNIDLLAKHKIEVSCDTPKLEKTKAPIGLIYEEDFHFTNRFVHRKDDKFRIKKNLEKTYKLNSKQKKVMNVIAETFSSMIAKKLPVYICLQADCGFGKTILAINFIIKCPYNKTFIVTHNKTASSQFAAKIKQFLPYLDVYVSDKGVRNLLDHIKTIPNPDILIFPSKHLINDEFIRFLQKNFSIGIVDETHISNFHNDSALRKFFIEYLFPTVLSMTATPRFNNSIYLGKLIKTSDIVNTSKPFKKIAYAITTDKTIDNFHLTSAYKLFQNAKKDAKHVRRQQCLSIDSNRRKLIVSFVLRHWPSLNARILILVEFVEEAQYYTEQFKSLNIDVFTRTGTDEVVESVQKYTENKEKYIIIGTVDKLGTGFDLPSCNTVFLSSLYNTKTDIQQYAGRCTRDYAPDNLAVRTFYYFLLRPHESLQIINFYKNMAKALKEIDWTIHSIAI